MTIKYYVYTAHEGGKTDGAITRYAVSRAPTAEEANKLPIAAEFPVNAAYDAHTQGIRANKFADYLNKILEITNDLERDQGI